MRKTAVSTACLFLKLKGGNDNRGDPIMVERASRQSPQCVPTFSSAQLSKDTKQFQFQLQLDYEAT